MRKRQKKICFGCKAVSIDRYKIVETVPLSKSKKLSMLLFMNGRSSDPLPKDAVF